MDPRQPNSSVILSEVLALFDAKGHEFYGEAIDQRHHGLQSATVAIEHGADDHLVIAALLHDIGHLIADVEHGPRSDRQVEDDAHEAIGARWLAPRFGPRVAQPVALHVIAKRYRCTVDPAYLAQLSETSRQTLQAQGGLLGPGAVARFKAHPGFDAALLVRDCDEQGKSAAMVTADLTSFIPVMERLISSAS